MSMHVSTVQFGASPLLMDSARDARSGRSHRERTAGPTWLSGAPLRASPESTLETHCAMDWRPPAACAAGGAPADARAASTAAAAMTGRLGETFDIIFYLRCELGLRPGAEETGRGAKSGPSASGSHRDRDNDSVRTLSTGPPRIVRVRTHMERGRARKVVHKARRHPRRGLVRRTRVPEEDRASLSMTRNS